MTHLPIPSTSGFHQSTAPLKAASTAKQRILSLDLLRGWAILGMIVMNIPEMGLNISGYFSDPYPGWSQTDQVLFWFRELFIEGNSRTLFTILFGASFMVIIAGGAKPAAGTDHVKFYVRRCAWMLLFGVVHATLLLWPGDVLFYYAIPGLLLLLFRAWNPKSLIILSLLLLTIPSISETRDDFDNARKLAAASTAIAKQKLSQPLSQDEKTALSAWENVQQLRALKRSEYQAELKARQGYLTSVAFQAKHWAKSFDWDAITISIEAFAYMLLGIALFKLGIITGLLAQDYYLRMGTLFTSVGLIINLHETWLKWSTLDGAEIWQDDITGVAGRTLMTLGIIGLVLAAAKSETGGRLLHPLTYAGRMALTNYLGQSLICAILFTGFGLFGKFGNMQLMFLGLAIVAVQIVFCWWWLRYFQMGPLEWLLRCLTRMRFEPLRR